MSTFSPDVLRAIAENDDLYVSPFREDGTTYGTPTQTWALVVDGNVYVRAARGQESTWYQAAITQTSTIAVPRLSLTTLSYGARLHLNQLSCGFQQWASRFAVRFQ